MRVVLIVIASVMLSACSEKSEKAEPVQKPAEPAAPAAPAAGSGSAQPTAGSAQPAAGNLTTLADAEKQRLLDQVAAERAAAEKADANRFTVVGEERAPSPDKDRPKNYGSGSSSTPP